MLKVVMILSVMVLGQPDVYQVPAPVVYRTMQACAADRHRQIRLYRLHHPAERVVAVTCYVMNEEDA